MRANKIRDLLVDNYCEDENVFLELEELERLSKIGRAIEKALERRSMLIIDYFFFGTEGTKENMNLNLRTTYFGGMMTWRGNNMEFLSEELKCVLCINYMKTSRGCDGNCRHNKECENIIKKVAELERLAKIGRAFEKAKNEDFGMFVYTPYAGAKTTFYSITDDEYRRVLEWCEREEGNEK